MSETIRGAVQTSSLGPRIEMNCILTQKTVLQYFVKNLIKTSISVRWKIYFVILFMVDTSFHDNLQYYVAYTYSSYIKWKSLLSLLLLMIRLNYSRCLLFMNLILALLCFALVCFASSRTSSDHKQYTHKYYVTWDSCLFTLIIGLNWI